MPSTNTSASACLRRAGRSLQAHLVRAQRLHEVQAAVRQPARAEDRCPSVSSSTTNARAPRQPSRPSTRGGCRARGSGRLSAP